MNFLGIFKFGNKFWKRAALGAALFFSFNQSLNQAEASPPRETYKDLIEKAYNLSLQKDRTQAVGILLSAIKKENKKTAAQKELLAALDQVSKVFYSDKAQQLYELGLSMRSSDPSTAQSKLQEAARLEPDNLSIEIALARQALSNNDCDAALSRVMKQKELFMASEELRLTAAQSDACLGKFEDYQAQRNFQDIKKSELSLFWYVAESEYLFKTGNFAKTQETALILQKIDSSFPEGYYWQWRSGVELKLKAEKAAQRYLNLCKTLSSRQQRQFLSEPQLCRRTTEIESFLKKNNNSEI